MTSYQQETSVVQIADNLYQGRVSAAWNISDKPNGGYMIAIATQALSQTLAHPDPLSVTAHYLRPGIPDADCEIATTLIRQGRTLSTARATLSQEGKPRLELLGSFGDLSVPASQADGLTIAAPDLPPPEECVERQGDIQGISLAISNRLDMRLHPDQIAPGESDQAEVCGWIRL
ncbi:MAG: acyl-CoA thioesterase, partial [Pseudomonadales bacterium]